MEARATFRESTVSKSAVAIIVALLAAFLLGGTGGYIVKSLTLTSSTSAGHTAVIQVRASEPSSAWNESNRRSGTQTVEGAVPAEAVRASGSGRSQDAR
jgi:hypothetical protein